MPLKFTAAMRKRITGRARAMLERALGLFPELAGKQITVGHSRAYLGAATVVAREEGEAELTIRLNVRRITYNTIGHELTHLVQGLSRGSGNGAIPGGEKACDVWTLARHALFADDAPSYLALPPAVRQNWPRYASRVRRLCARAIEKRATERFYIRWLETEILKLGGSAPRRQHRPHAQLELPLPSCKRGSSAATG